MFKRKVSGNTNFIDRPDLHEIDLVRTYPGVKGYLVNCEVLVQQDCTDPTPLVGGLRLIKNIRKANRLFSVFSLSNDRLFLSTMINNLGIRSEPPEDLPDSPLTPISSEALKSATEVMGLSPKQIGYIGDTALTEARDAIVAAELGSAFRWQPPTE